jgi:hypothetical protein
MPFHKKDYSESEFVTYFESLGYRVVVDWNTKAGESWFEICDNYGPILQIDQNVPIWHVVQDLMSLHTGKDSLSDLGREYKISGEETDRSKELYKRVYQCEYPM